MTKSLGTELESYQYDCSIGISFDQASMSILEDVLIQVGKFYTLCDFIVIDMDESPRLISSNSMSYD